MKPNIGDRVKSVNDECEYVITNLPGYSGLFPEDYRGLDESDGLHGLISPSDITHINGVPVDRATKPEPQELPEDGALVVVTDDEENPGIYFLCEFQADGPRFQRHPRGGCFYSDEISGWTDTGIRLKTQAEREREELAELVASAARIDVVKDVHRTVADAILAKYKLEDRNQC